MHSMFCAVVRCLSVMVYCVKMAKLTIRLFHHLVAPRSSFPTEYPTMKLRLSHPSMGAKFSLGR